jgi:hypothetical protein
MKETRPRKPRFENRMETPTPPGKNAGGLDRNSLRLQSREKAVLLRISNETMRLARARESLRLVMPSRVKMRNREAEQRNLPGLMIVARLPRKQHRVRSRLVPGTRRVQNSIKKRNNARNASSSQSSARSRDDDK